MKRRAFNIGIFFIFVVGSLSAQCLVNSDFDQFSGNLEQSPTGCPYISMNNTVNWRKSHGSPQIFTGAFPQHYGYMWAASSQGTTSGGWHVSKKSEGMYASYTFIQNEVYKIRLAVKTQGDAVGFWGIDDIEERFYLYAANNITEGTDHCGDDVPNIPNKQLIKSEEFAGTSWTIFEYDFIPNQNFSQIWIYPELTLLNTVVDNNAQYDFYIDYLEICPPEACWNTVTYNSGVLPTNDTKHGFINIGSSFGGNGFVTTAGKAFTTMKGTRQIDFAPDFRTPNFGITSGFQAIIEPCNIGDQRELKPFDLPKDDFEPLGGELQESEYVPILPKFVTQNKIEQPGLKIIPNPTSDKFILAFECEDVLLVEMLIKTTFGQLIRRYTYTSNKGRNLFTIDASNLKSGLYFVHLRLGVQKEYVSKVVVIK